MKAIGLMSLLRPPVGALVVVAGCVQLIGPIGALLGGSLSDLFVPVVISVVIVGMVKVVKVLRLGIAPSPMLLCHIAHCLNPSF